MVYILCEDEICHKQIVMLECIAVQLYDAIKKHG